MGKREKRGSRKKEDKDYVMYTEQQRKKSPKRKKSKGSWKAEETAKYLTFLQENREVLDSEFQRRSNRIFIKMQRFVQSRNCEQCRSHHQKLMSRFSNNIGKTIEMLQIKLQKNRKKLMKLRKQEENKEKSIPKKPEGQIFNTGEDNELRMPGQREYKYNGYTVYIESLTELKVSFEMEEIPLW